MSSQKLRTATSSYAIAALLMLVGADLSAQGFGRGRRFRRGQRPELSRPLSQFTTRDFSGSANCAFCHGGITDAQGHDVSIDTDWRSAPLANSARDPIWQAKLSSEVQRNPSLKKLIEEKCSRCHMPMARTQAAAQENPVAILDQGFLSPSHSLHEAAMEGVSCSLCHQIRPKGLGRASSFTGGYAIETGAPIPDRPMYGPYAEPFSHPMQMHVGFTPKVGSHMTRSALCGACHTLFTPIVDKAGNDSGSEFPEQMTYPEWKHSLFASEGKERKSCQDCHLPDACSPASVSNRPPWLPGRSPFGLHFFVGANTFLTELLLKHAGELGVTATPAQLKATASRMRDQLSNETAALSVKKAEASSGVLELELEVENRAGHKLPSGIPFRRVWLHVTVRDDSGQFIFESGRPESNGRIAQNNADRTAGAVEPHWDVITRPDQVQIYEPVMEDLQGNVTYTLLRAAAYRKDNRLLPAGFDKKSAAPEIAVRGSATDDPNFSGGTDRITYRINLAEGSPASTVSAELLYQAVSWPFVRDLRRDAGDPLVDRMVNYWDAADKTPEVISAVREWKISTASRP